MSEAKEPDGYVVRFNVRELWRLRGVCLLSLLFCVGGFFVALSERNPGGAAVLFRPLAVVLTPVGTIATLWLLGWTFVWSRRPALTVGDEGLTVGFKMRRPFLVPWSDVWTLNRSKWNSDNSSECFCIVLEKDADVEPYFPGLWMPVNVQTGGAVLQTQAKLLDADWAELTEAIGTFRPLSDDERAELLDLTSEIEKTIRGRLTHEGDLVSLEDYQRVFRKAPLGCWSDSVYSVSPGDSFASFCRNGFGSVGSGTNMMLGGMREVQWRETGEEFCIEVRANQDNARWHRVDYSFSETEEGIVISFDAWGFGEENEDDDLEGDASEDWKDGLFFAMTYGGSC